MTRVRQIVAQIKALTVRELQELNQELKKLGLPPVEPTAVGAKPRRSPPSLSGAAAKPWPKEERVASDSPAIISGCRGRER